VKIGDVVKFKRTDGGALAVNQFGDVEGTVESVSGSLATVHIRAFEDVKDENGNVVGKKDLSSVATVPFTPENPPTQEVSE